MNTAIKVLAALGIAAAALAPAAAPARDVHVGYWIISDYTGPDANVLGGPFTYDDCQFALLKNNFKAPIHCEIRTW